MARAEQADVHRLRHGTAQGHHLPLLQHPQQARLQRQRHVADLVQEEDAAVGLLQLALHALLARAGEAAAAVAEQLALDQVLRNRRAVERHERLAGPRTGPVQRTGEGFLAGPGLAVQQHRHVALEHLQRAGEIRAQRRIAQAQARVRHRRATYRLGQGAQPRATQPGVQQATIMDMQRPAGIRLRAGAGQQIVQAYVEQALDGQPDQRFARLPEQRQGRLVHRVHAPAAIEGQKPLAEQPDELGLGMEAQQVAILALLQERAAFDQLGRQRSQRHGVELALPGQLLADAGHVQHRLERPLRIEQRDRRAAQPGVAPAEVFVAADGQRLTFHQAGADAVGALHRLAPHRPQPEARALELVVLGRVAQAVDDHAFGVGQQHRATVAAQLLVQAVHLPAGDGDDVVQRLAALGQPRMLDHARGVGAGRIEAVLLQAAPPGARDGRVVHRPLGERLAFAETHDPVRVLTNRGHRGGSPRGVATGPA